MLQAIRSLDDARQQYAWLEHMRRTQPIWRDETSGCWHVFRYDDVHRALTDYAHFSSKRSLGGGRPASPGSSIITMDPPEHRQYRNLLAPFFTPRALASLSGRITAIVQELLDRVRPNGAMDLIEDLAYPLPVTVIAEMLGVPIEDRPMFKRWADGLLTLQLSDAELTQSAGDARSRQVQPTIREMSEYFVEKLEEHRRRPQPDLISELLAAEVDGVRLTQDEIISFSQLLLLAGHVTTTNLLGLAILCFDAHPEALARLQREPELMPSAIEEVLRYASVVWRVARITTTDVTIGDARIPANSMVFAWLASANHDDAQFPDPQRFDITRSPNRHLAFGHGIHFCLGAPLARLEASIALPMIIEQMPRLRRVPGSEVVLQESRVLFGPKRLPIAFTPSAAEPGASALSVARR